MRKFSVLAILLAMVLLFASCDSLQDITGLISEIASDEATSGSNGEFNYIDGTVGQTISTYFFDFIVKDSGEADAAALGWELDEGNKLIWTEIYIENTLGREIPMFYNDFLLDHADFESILDPIPFCELPDQLDDEYELADGESVQGKFYFEVPNSINIFEVFTYDDFDGQETENLYFVKFTV